MNRTATAIWKGTLDRRQRDARNAKVARWRSSPTPSRAGSRTKADKSGTNPEELIAAAHAGCFAMQLSHLLAENGTPAEKLDAKAVVTYGPAAGGGFEITESAITLVGTVPGIDEAKFKQLAEQAKAGCPVSKALGAIKVSLDAKLG